jgi:hypothetical protein
VAYGLGGPWASYGVFAPKAAGSAGAGGAYAMSWYWNRNRRGRRMQREVIDIVTNAAGAFTGYTQPVDGHIWQMRYIPDATTPLDTGADFTVTLEGTGVAVYSESNIGTSAFTKAPRQATHTTAGVAAVFAAAGEAVLEPVQVSRERIKLVVAQGGASKLGKLHFWVG